MPDHESLAARMERHGLGHITLRDLAKLEECFGVDLVRVTKGRQVTIAQAPPCAWSTALAADGHSPYTLAA